MKAISLAQVAMLLSVSLVVGSFFSWLFTNQAEPVPIGGYPAAVVLLLIAAAVLFFGLKIKRYLNESKTLKDNDYKARKHQLDMIQAFKIVLFARAGVLSGAMFTGFIGGQLLHLLFAGGTLFGSILPLSFGTFSALVLLIVSLIVQGWGKIGPNLPHGSEAAN